MMNFKNLFVRIFTFSILLNFNTLAQVVSVSPAQNALNVSPTTTIQVTFSEPMMPSSFNDTSSFLIYGKTSGRYRGTFSFNDDSTVMTFTPNNSFKKVDVITVNITKKIRTASNLAIEPVIYDFTVISNPSTGKFVLKSEYGPLPQIFGRYTSQPGFLYDLDNDGDLDIVVGYDNGNYSIFKNNGYGAFPTKEDYSAGIECNSVYVSDNNNDGVPNINITRPFNSYNDLNGDGYVDAIIANGVALNNGDGSFASTITYPMTEEIAEAFPAFVSDIDGDGDLDIIAPNNWRPGYVAILKNNGEGKFAPKIEYPIRAEAYSIFISDVDGDGDNDIVTVHVDGIVSILKNISDGSFLPAETYSPGGGWLQGVFVSDINGDGSSDIVVGRRDYRLSIMKNNKNGTFSYDGDIATSKCPRCVLIGDVDNDGDGDLVVLSQPCSGDAASSVSIYININNDISVQSIIPASGFVSANQSVPVSALVSNLSYTTKTFTILSEIDTITGVFDYPLFRDIQTISVLAPNETSNVSFGNWTAQRNGQYKLRVISQLTEDDNRSNDTLITIFNVLAPRQPLLVIYENDAQGGSAVKSALTNKGYIFDEYLKSGDISFSLSGWQRIIWIAGTDSSISNPNADSLISFLNAGKRLLLLGNRLVTSQSGDGDTVSISSRAILIRQKLGINWVGNFTGSATVSGITGDSVSNGLALAFGISSGGKERTTREGNYLVLDSIMTYSVGGNAGWKRDGGNYKIVYGGFPIHNATPTAMREQFLDQALRWLLLSSELGKISGQVFEDLNGNGNKDGGEPGLAGWTVSLSNRVTASTITDDGGNYVFNGLPSGQYTVSQTLKSGWQQSAPPSGTYSVSLGTGDTTSGIAKDFGDFRPNSITIRKYEDRDGNFATTNDRVLRSWNLRLYSDSINVSTLDSSVASAATLVVTNLNPGKYIVAEADSTGWIHLGKVVNGSPILTSASTDTFILESNQTKVVDFINFHPRISIHKFVDADGDFLTTVDRSAKKWNLTLYANSISPGNIISQISSAESLEVFDLPSGTYIAVEADSVGWTHIGKIRNGTPIQGTAKADTFTYTSGQLHQLDFVNFNPNTITIRKFHDIDGNFGTTNDRVLKKWNLILYRNSISPGNIVQSVSSAESLVVSNLGNGTYIAVEADSNTWYHIGKIRNGISQQGTFSSDTFTVAGGQHIVLDFVNTIPTITIRKFKDDDGNFNTANDRSLKRWNLVIYRNLVNPDSIVASVSSSESLVVRNPYPALYIAREADSTGWTHLGTIIDGGAGNMSSEREIQFVQSGTESHTADFINTNMSGIIVSSFLDQDGDFRTVDGSLKNWSLKLYRIVGPDTTIIDSVQSAPSFTKANLPEGSYLAVEADSSLPWTHIGTELYTNGSLDYRIGGTQNKISFSLSNGQSKHARFLNFNRNRIKLWTAVQDCNWSNGYNWDPPGIPIPGDSIVVPDTARCPLVIPAGSSVGTIIVAAQETVYISPGNFVSNGDVTVNGTMIADAGDSSLITVSGDWTVSSFNAGQSKVLFTGLTTQKIEGNGNKFYKLKIADGATNNIQTNGSFSVQEYLYLGGNIDAAGDTIHILNPSINSVSGSGKIIRGMLQRRIGQGITSAYRFESARSYLQFDGTGTYPTEVAMTVYPNTLPTSFGDDWVEVPSQVDTVNNTITAYGINEFSKWCFGIPRPKVLNDYVSRIYSIINQGGSGFNCALTLRYDQSEIPFGLTEDSLKLMKLPENSERKVNAGWNMLSLSHTPLDRRKTAIFPSAISEAFSYEDRYIRKDTLSPGIGYWIKFSTADTFEVTGGYIVAETIAVATGWNLIGSISSLLSVRSILCDPPTMIANDFFEYNTGYFRTDTIYPGFGYWVKVNQAGYLILSSESQMMEQARIKIVATSELPPPPPGDVISAKDIPIDYSIEDAYPNPFNPVTTLKYSLPSESRVKLTIYNVLGQVVTILQDGVEDAGYRSVEWNASNVANGLYFYRIEAISMIDPGKSFAMVKKMVLLK